MKVNLKTISLFSLFLIVVSITLRVNIFSFKKPINWNDDRKLTLKDFTAFKLPFYKSPHANDSMKIIDNFSYIYTNIVIENKSDSLFVYARFYPNRSYVFKEKDSTGYLLNHEFIHFSITEIWARKLRESISLSENISKNEIEILLNDIWTKERKMQERYDDETDHSINFEKQQRWNNIVDSILYSLEDYKNPNVGVVVN